MSFGFVTASGKKVDVSEEALKKARNIFEGLGGESDRTPTGKSETTRHLTSVTSK